MHYIVNAVYLVEWILVITQKLCPGLVLKIYTTRKKIERCTFTKCEPRSANINNKLTISISCDVRPPSPIVYANRIDNKLIMAVIWKTPHLLRRDDCCSSLTELERENSVFLPTNRQYILPFRKWGSQIRIYHEDIKMSPLWRTITFYGGGGRSPRIFNKIG